MTPCCGQVRSLSQQQCEVLVLSGKPAAYNAAQQTEGAAALIEVENNPTQYNVRQVNGSWCAQLQRRHNTKALHQQLLRLGCQSGVAWITSVPGQSWQHSYHQRM